MHSPLMSLTAASLMPYILIEASSEHDIDELHPITYSVNRLLFFIDFAQQGQLELCSVPFSKLKTGSGDNCCLIVIFRGNIASTRDHEAVHKFGDTGYVLENRRQD